MFEVEKGITTSKMPISALRVRKDGRGGYRIGAGAKKGSLQVTTLSRHAALEIWRAAAEADIHEIYRIHLEKCMAGDMVAIKEWYDRYYGKVTDKMDITVGVKPLPII